MNDESASNNCGFKGCLSVRAAKKINCTLACGYESRFTPEYRHAAGCEGYVPDLRAGGEQLAVALAKALDYFDTAMMCGNDLSDLAEPARRAIEAWKKAVGK